jgi:integrase/recombinase XerD
MMEDWYERSMKALQLNGLAKRSQECYTRMVRMLVDFYGKTPDLITEDELQEYFLHRKNVSKWSAAYMRICYSGIRFFFVNVLQRQWHLFDYLRAKREQKLPAVLSQEELVSLLSCVRTPHNYAFLFTIYSCGLRLDEALNLEVSDIDKNRMMIHVHRGKGAKDRYVPLPESTLVLLRKYWASHRNPRLIFPALGRGGKDGPLAQTPMAKTSVQGAMIAARKASGIRKRGVSIHTLRHSYATHLLESGVNLRAIQRYMGHSNIDTTLVYLHLTQKGHDDAAQIINQHMGDLSHGNN